MALTNIILFFLILLPPTYAYSAFKPDCPLPPPGTNYVAGPNIRSTLTILWNCLSIILLCTWNILHLNVPVSRGKAKDFVEKRLHKEPTRWRVLAQKIRWWILDNATPVKWMVITVLAPEILVGKAFCEWRSSIDVSKQVRDQRWKVLLEPIGVHLANMGYFVLDLGGPEQLSYLVENKPNPVNTDLQKVKEGFDHKAADTGEYLKDMKKQIKAALEDESLSPSEKINIARLESRFWALNARQWDVLPLVLKDLVDFPDIQELQLEKLGQRGMLVKAITLIQVNYLVIQLICRKVRELPSTQLEIAALAFAVCSTVTYAFYWNRPQGVQATRIIKATEAVGGDVLQSLIKEVGRHGPTYIWLSPRFKQDFDPSIGPHPIPNDSNTVIRSTWEMRS